MAAAVFFIVLASWILFRYAAPKSWKEWSGAGLVQAFIIALYAEMFGFPLTLYLLVRVFGLDVTPEGGGNFWASLFGNPNAMVIAMFLGWGLFVIPGLVLLGRGWREIHAATRTGRLATDGLYGVVRHPQYTGIFMILFGEGVVHWPTVFSVALFPVIVAAYTWLARREESAMVARYGERYLEYQRRIPMFLPRPRDWGLLFRPPPSPNSRDPALAEADDTVKPEPRDQPPVSTERELRGERPDA